MLLSANQLLDIRITGVEMLGAIENCRTSDEGRQWAVKRTRSSCSGGRRKSSVCKGSKGSEVTKDKVPSRIREMPDSDSEKVGISILGRHFGDSFEIVPIKKRRFLFVGSPSSPLQSSYSDDSDHLLESKPASCNDSLSFDKDHDRCFIANKSSSLNHIIEEATDAADFSGISILAAAACNSEMVGESTSSSNLALVNSYKEFHLEYTKDNKSHMLCENKEQQFRSLEVLQENNVNMRSHPTSPAAGDAKFDELQNMKISMGSLQTVSNNLGSPSVSRLHWDLNTDMDAWNSNADGLVISDVVAADNSGEHAKVNEELAVFETCQSVTENGESTNPPKFGQSLVNMVGTPVNSCMIISNESLDNPNAINGLSVSNHDNDNFCPNVHKLIEEEQHLDATDFHLVNSTVETKHMHYQHNSILRAQVVSSAGNILGTPKVDSLDIKSIDIEKDEVNAGLEMKIEAKAFSVNINCEVNSGTSKARPICVGSERTIAPNAEKSSDDRHLIDVQGGNCSFSSAEKVGNVTLDDNICGNLVKACKTFGKTISFDSADMISDLHVTEFSGVVGMTQPDQLTCEVTSAAKCGSVTKDSKGDVDSTSDLKPIVCISSGTATAKTDANLVEDAVGTHLAVQSCMEICINLTGDHNSDAFDDGAVPVSGMEKVNLPVDDDSQFEDGEFIESVLHNWEEDAAEEVESEHVDYGSDNGLNDTCETVSIVPASVSSSDVNMAFKERTLSDADKADDEKDGQVAFPQPSSKCSSKSDVPDVVRGMRFIDEGDTLHHANHSVLNTSNKPSNFGFQNEGDKTREPFANVRLKSSGWDLLPENHRLAGNNLDREFGSGKQDGSAGSFSVFGNDEPLVRSDSAFRGGLSSRIERLKSSDESHRKDKIFDKLSRYNVRDNTETKAERNTGALNSGWCGSLRHTQGGRDDEHWFDSTNCRGPRHHNSPGYYDAQSYARPSSRNAAADAVAKVESNGFVVAFDGTLVKAGGAGSAGRLPKKSSNGSSQSSHPIVAGWVLQDDRDRAYGGQRRPRNPREMSDRHFGVGGQAGKCAHDIDNDDYDDRSMPHDRMESSLAGHRLSTRDRSSSPYHRGSRSSISRMERRRSPNPRPSFEERMNVYGSASGTVDSPSHSSRWVDDDRKDSPNHLREHGYGRSSGRSSPLKVYADHRFDSIDSQRRPKPDDYYHHNQRHLPSNRKTEVAGFGRGYKYDGRNDRRAHGGRYEFIRSMRQCDIDSNEKRVR